VQPVQAAADGRYSNRRARPENPNQVCDASVAHCRVWFSDTSR
jgi:hypothetical protein